MTAQMMEMNQSLKYWFTGNTWRYSHLEIIL